MYPHGTRVLKLEAGDLSRAANVHLASFPNGALTLLGAEAVRRYYEWQLLGPHECLALGAFSESNLLGFFFGGVFHGAMSGFLSLNRSFLLRRVALRPWLLKNPLFRQRVYSGLHLLRHFRRQLQVSAGSAESHQLTTFGILAIAVHPRSQRSGVGNLLMAEAEKSARNLGFTRMHLSVQIANQTAIKFYERLGWHKHSNNGSWKGEMLKILSP